MLHHPKKTSLKDILLKNKVVDIMVTNVCNLSCGGCITLCGLIPKNKLWFIPLDQLKSNIKTIMRHMSESHYSKMISLFGGEPTLHPKYDEILELLKSFAPQKFQIATNGRIPYSDTNERHAIIPLNDTNIQFLYDQKNPKKCDLSQSSFTPTLVAPIDVMPEKSKEYFWERAQKVCPLWKTCGSVIYDNKAYICNPAASIDHIEGGHRGWPVEENSNPFDRTDQEITDQATNFCYRCAWSIFDTIGVPEKGKTTIPWQVIDAPSLITKTNMELPLKRKDGLDIIEI